MPRRKSSKEELLSRLRRLEEAMLAAHYGIGKPKKGETRMPLARLAKDAGVSKGQITRLLNGDRQGDFKTYELLAQPLNVRAEWLFLGTLPRQAVPSSLAEDPPMRVLVSWYLAQKPLMDACNEKDFRLSTVIKAKAAPQATGEFATAAEWVTHLTHLENVDMSTIPATTVPPDVAIQHIKRSLRKRTLTPP